VLGIILLTRGLMIVLLLYLPAGISSVTGFPLHDGNNCIIIKNVKIKEKYLTIK